MRTAGPSRSISSDRKVFDPASIQVMLSQTRTVMAGGVGSPSRGTSKWA